jgi:hypothetical protein
MASSAFRVAPGIIVTTEHGVPDKTIEKDDTGALKESKRTSIHFTTKVLAGENDVLLDTYKVMSCIKKTNFGALQQHFGTVCMIEKDGTSWTPCPDLAFLEVAEDPLDEPYVLPDFGVQFEEQSTMNVGVIGYAGLLSRQEHEYRYGKYGSLDRDLSVQLFHGCERKVTAVGELLGLGKKNIVHYSPSTYPGISGGLVYCLGGERFVGLHIGSAKSPYNSFLPVRTPAFVEEYVKHALTKLPADESESIRQALTAAKLYSF